MKGLVPTRRSGFPEKKTRAFLSQKAPGLRSCRQEWVSRAALLSATKLTIDRSSLTTALLQLDKRARQAGSGVVEEDAHAQRLGALHGHEAHLPANMVDVVQPVQLRFVAIGIPFQARDALLDRLPEPRTDLEAFLGAALDGHGKHLGAGFPEAESFLILGLKFLPLLPILTKRHSLRQITESPNFGNLVSENRAIVRG
jgi:hypothetical protein